MVMPSAASFGQNQMSSAAHAATTNAAAVSRGADKEQSGSSAARKHKWAIRNAASPSTNDGSHHGMASRKSPAADPTSAPTSQRRSRWTGWVPAAAASSTAGAALTAGCNQNRPANSAPDGNRRAVKMRK